MLRRARRCPAAAATRRARLFSAATAVELDAAAALQVTWAGGGGSSSSRYDARWLAENCPSLRQGAVAGPQRLPRPAGRSTRPVAAAVTSEAEVLVDWACGHQSRFCADWLRAHCYSAGASARRKGRCEPLATALRADEPVPTVSYDAIMGSEEGVLQWTRHLDRCGLCVVRGVPQADGAVATIAARIAPPIHTLYGRVWNVRDKKDPINVAYTSAALEPHMDLAYYESPPGIQLLHCLEFSPEVVGGESIFYDTFVLAELLRQRSPAAFEVLTRVPATFQTDHMQREHPAQMYYTRPHIAVSGTDHRGLPMVSAVFWAPPFEGTLQAAPEDIEPYYEAYDTFNALMCDPDVAAEWRVRFRLEAGEVATFNQRRLLHGRDCFTLHGGERHLQVQAPWPLSWHVPIVRRTQTLATRRTRVALASDVSDGLAECTGRWRRGAT